MLTLKKPRDAAGYALAAWVLTSLAALQVLMFLTTENPRPMDIEDFHGGVGLVRNIGDLIGLNFVAAAGLVCGLLAWLIKRSVPGAVATLVAMCMIPVLTVLAFLP